MKYNPTSEMKVKDVELINQLSQLLENQLMGRELNNYKYLAIDEDSEVWLYTNKPNNDGCGVWDNNPAGHCFKISLRIPTNIQAKISKDNARHLLFKLGSKEE